ncbi:MFS transporter [Streptomyces sp. ME03-5709C]|nr:MFS transporter [Streptomyces sp. ME03-5709C]
MLLDFGVLSLVGIWLTGVFIDRHHRGLVICSTAFFALAALVLGVLSGSTPTVYLAAAVRGVAFGGAATLFQSATMSAAGRAADVAQSMLVTMWNIGIAGGGVIGGALLAGLGARSLTWAVLALLVPSAVVVVRAKGHAFPSSDIRDARESI